MASKYLLVKDTYIARSGINGVGTIETVQVTGDTTYHFHVFTVGGTVSIGSTNESDVQQWRDEVLKAMNKEGKVYEVAGTSEGPVVFAGKTQSLPPVCNCPPPAETAILLIQFRGGSVQAEFPDQASAEKAHKKYAKAMGSE